MANYQIPISYVISASAVLPQAGLEPLKMSTVLILTDDEPITELTTSYEIYRTVTGAVKTWGTETRTIKMLQRIFGQTPNILNNNGYVIVAPFNNTPATSGTLTSGVITPSKFASVSTGALKLIVNNVEQLVTGLDFTGVETVQDVAEVISSAYETVNVSVLEDDKLLFTNTTTGTNSTIRIAQAGTTTDLYGANYLNGANATYEDGTAEIKENYTTAILRLAGELYFNAIQTTRTLSDSEVIEASNTVESLTPARILFVESSNLNALTPNTGLFATVENNIYTKTLFYSTSDEDAKYFASAYISKLLSVNYSGSKTCLTMNLKDLSGVTADTNISESLLEQCKAVGCDVFPSVEGLPKVLSNRKGAYYIDQIQNLIWFVNAIQRTVFNELATTRTKIPQTEQGMQIITNAISQVCNQAVINGYLNAGKWNSADTFGDYDDFMRNIEENGYYIYHLPIAQQQQAEREERIAPMFQIAGKEAGGVHRGNILIYVEP